jgi:restriction system protein
MTQNPSFSDATLELLALRERSTPLDKLRSWLAAPWRLARYELACRKARLLQSGLLSLSFPEFQTLMAEAFRRIGYTVLENTGESSVGIDLVLDREGQKLFVQCKQWKVLKVGVKPVRELAGVMSAKGVPDGFFVSAGSYTREARAFADKVGIALVDGVGLEKLVREIREGEPLRGPRGISAGHKRANGRRAKGRQADEASAGPE